VTGARYRTLGVLALLVASGISACAMPVAGPDDSLCAFDVTDANAWVNRMPTVGERSGPTLNVMVRIMPAVRIRALVPEDDTGDVLKLAVEEGNPPLQAGTLSWRMYAPETLYRAVEISCNGKAVTRIDEIDTVY